ncbi:MAG TPA: DUF2721 domain-containing protein [Polymorphobacter sp.]|nr:DUF2721 domain-containing protein [Polymorphobacter sp.]
MLELPQFVPDAQRLSQIFSAAAAPTFFLGSVAAFVSLMSSRLAAVTDRVRNLNAIDDEDESRAHLKADIDRLRRRAHFLHSGMVAALRAGICATLLLAILFVTEFMGFHYAYGAGMLFIVATIFLGFALYRFAQEASIGYGGADELQ